MTEPATAVALPSSQQSRAKKRIHRTLSQWQSLIDDFHRSGLTKVAFSKQHGIATSSLNRWQRILEGNPGGGYFIDVTEPLSLDAEPASPSRDTAGAWHDLPTNLPNIQ